MELIEKTSVLILAAGQSMRMGRPKFMLMYNEKYTFLEKMCLDYSRYGFSEIKLVLNPEGEELIKNSGSKIIDNKQIVINSFPELEKFNSIQTGMKFIKDAEHIFIHPVDNPYVLPDVIRLLLENNKIGDYQVPEFKGRGGHPVLISAKIREKIIEQNQININFKDLLSCFKKYRVKVDNPEVLCNINTEPEYEQFRINHKK